MIETEEEYLARLARYQRKYRLHHDRSLEHAKTTKRRRVAKLVIKR